LRQSAKKQEGLQTKRVRKRKGYASMSKSRYTSTDVRATVGELRGTMLGHRVANIYDLNDRTYLFKFAIPGVSEKPILLMESGIRFHTTKFMRDKADMPSPFAMKLRKHLRTKRLESIRQLGTDRVVDFKFGTGESANHIILEMYASGNIVLTDEHYEILALVRSHTFNGADVSIQVGEIYPFTQASGLLTAPAAPSSDSPQAVDGNGDEPANEIVAFTADQFRQWALAKCADHDTKNAELAAAAAANAEAALLQEARDVHNDKKGRKAKKKKGGKARKIALRQLLLSPEAGLQHYGAEVTDHCVCLAGMSPGDKVKDRLCISEDGEGDEEGTRLPLWTDSDLDRLLSALREEGRRQLELLDEAGLPGYVILADPPSTALGEEKSKNGSPKAPEELQFVEFTPRLYLQHQHKASREYASFNDAADDFFRRVEEQRIDKIASAAEDAAKMRVDKFRSEQEAQMSALEQQQTRLEEMAALIEYHAENVDRVLLVLNTNLSSGMTWEDIGAMVATETAAGNSIAALVWRLRLEDGKVLLRLPVEPTFDDEDQDTNTHLSGSGGGGNQRVKKTMDMFGSDSESEDEDEDEEGHVYESAPALHPSGGGKDQGKGKGKFVEVTIDLSLSAYANARTMYGSRKVAKQKAEKVQEHSSKALAAVEQQAAKQLAKSAVRRGLAATRKVHWFEKFNWFLTTEGYLVISGRDAQQNDMLVKRYLREGDAYVHADCHGASSCIVRAKWEEDSKEGRKPKPLSQFALQEAGAMTVCRSGSWKAKMVSSAWWVHASQVSKSAPTGEYLSTGSFMIYGKKNFLPPQSLEMGFGVMFRLDDGSVSRHLHDCRDKNVDIDDDAMSQLNEAYDRYGLEASVSAAPSIPNVSAKGKDRKDKDGMGKQQTEPAVGQDRSQGQTQGAVGAQPPPGAKPAAAPEYEGSGKKKKLSKKKARKYADQDEEDRELARQALGHVKEDGSAPAGVKGRRNKDKGKDKDKVQSGEMLSLEERQRKAGVHLVVNQWEEMLARLHDSGRAGLMRLVDAGMLAKGEIEADELRALATLDELSAQHVLALFEEGLMARKVGNKSGFMAGIVRRVSKDSRKGAFRDSLTAMYAPKAQAAEGYDDDELAMQKKKGVRLERGQKKVKKLDDGEESDDAEGSWAETPEMEKERIDALAADEQEQGDDKDKKLEEQQEDVELEVEEESDEELQAAGGDVLQEAKISRTQRNKLEAREIKALLEEEGFADEEEGKAADDIDKLTGVPLPEDVLLYAVPVCGPYSSLERFKYRVKLTPGVAKKGKAAKAAVEVFCRDGGGCSATEKALIKALTDPEMVAIMIGDCKVSAPGLQSMQRQVKSQKKGGKK